MNKPTEQQTIILIWQKSILSLSLFLLSCQPSPSNLHSIRQSLPTAQSASPTPDASDTFNSVKVLFQAQEPDEKNIKKIIAALDELVKGKLIKKHNELALKIFKKLNKQSPSKNILFSPLLVTSALITFYNLGSEETRQKIRQILDLQDMSDEEINHQYELLQIYSESHFESSLWLKTKPTQLASMTDLLKKLGVSVFLVSDDSNKPLLESPQWPVKNNHSLLNKPNKTFFTNKESHQVHWPRPFFEELQSFEVNRNKRIEIPTLTIPEDLSTRPIYSLSDYPELDVLTMSYHWFLPGPYSSIQEQLEQITPEWYQKRVIDQFKRSGVFISIPKFSLREATDLLSLLKLLEVEQPERILDVSKLYSAPTYLTDSIQISSINADKNGVNVADSFEDSYLGYAESIFKFRANRPFFFIGGRSIFSIMGVINDPSLP